MFLLNIKLYNNASEPNRLDKTITLVQDFTDCHLKENCDVRNPVFLIGKKDGMTVRKNVNYLYCSTFDRYYFIENIVYGIGGLFEIQCKCDVLMSFKDDIMRLECVFARQENLFNTYLNDSEFLCYNTPLIQQKAFPYGFSEGFSGVLTVVGGSGA